MTTQREAIKGAREALARGRLTWAADEFEVVPFGRPRWSGAGIDGYRVDHRAGTIRHGFYDPDFGTWRPSGDARDYAPKRPAIDQWCAARPCPQPGDARRRTGNDARGLCASCERDLGGAPTFTKGGAS